MLELRNAETGEVISDPAIAHGPTYDPLGHYMGYVIAVDRVTMMVPAVKFLLVDTDTGTALVHSTVERNPMLPENQRIWRLMPHVSQVGDPTQGKATPDHKIGVFGFVLALDLNQAEAVMEAQGIARVSGYESVWRDSDGVSLLYVDSPQGMRGRTVSKVYVAPDFEKHPQASEMLAVAERCLYVTGGKVTVL